MVESAEAGGPRAYRYVARGTVQGVGFRAFVWREAARLGLSGWVRNRTDGTVEVVASGPRAALDALENALRRGPRWARVTGLSREAVPVATVEPGFSVRPTV